MSQQAQADGVKLYFTDDNPQVYEGRDVFRAPKEALSDAESGSMLAAYGADPAGYYEHEMYHINRERNPAMARRAERLIAVSIDQQSSLFKWYEQHLLKGYAERGVKIGFDDVMEELAANVSHDYLTHGTVSEKYSRYFEGGRVPDKVLEALRALREAQKSSAAGTGDAPQGRARTTPYGPNTVGAAQMNERGYSHLQNEYGTIKPGENPARTVDVPKRTEKGNRVSQFTRTEMEAAATPDSLIEHFEKSVEEGLFSYRPLSDQKALDSAVQTIEDTGFSTAVKLFERAVDGGGAVNKKDMVLGQVLYAEAAAAGDTATAMRLAAELAAAGTKAGQSVQALRMLKKLTPEGKLYYLEKSVQQLNNQRLAPIEKKNERRAKAGAEPLAGPEQITIREELARRLLDAKGEKQVKEAETAIIKDVARQLPATWTDKWNAWRYLSMLGNPRTHIRNIIGNAAFIPARSLKNNIGALIERAALPVGERTKAVLNPVSKADKARKAFARGDFETMSDVVTGGGKLNPQQVIESEKPIFKNKLLEAARKFNGNALEAEDAFFLKGAYADSMAQYMKANRLTQADMKGGVLEKARSYAISEAQKATYRDASAVSQALNDFKRKNKVTQVLGEGLLPFTKTPINILKRGIEYSPAGLLKSLTADAVLVRKGNMSANEMIDHMAAGMSGTMVTALGMWLAHMGLLSGGLGDDKEEKFKKDQGAQEYALTIGNKSYTLDWAAPTALPFFVGVEVEKQLAMDGEAMNFKRAVEALSHIAEPVYNMSMLQGVENLFGSFSETGAISDAMMDTAAGYLSQAVPTLLGQVARTVDDTRRNSYYNDKTTPLPYKVQTALNKNLAKLPIASKTLPAKVNVWGEEMESGKGGTLGRLAQNMLSPGYYGEMRDTPLDREVLRVYKQTGEGKALPTAPQKYMEYKGARHDLSAKEYEQFAKTKGQTQKALAEKVIGLPIYKNSSDDTKADILQDVYAYGSYVARKEYLPEYEKTGWEQKAYEAKKQGIAPETYLQFRYEADTDGQGGVSMREAGEYLRGSNLRQEQKEALWRQAASDEAVGKFETAKKEGLGDVYLQMLWEADTGSSKDPSGGPNGSLSKAEIQAYLDAARLEQDAKRLLFSLASTAKNPY